MIAALGIGLLGMFMLSAEPPDIAGQWTGDNWGQVVLKKTSGTEYTGTYSDTVGKQPGKIQLKWSRIEGRFNGAWWEGEDRFGDISLRLVGKEIHGALTTDGKSKINPATPRLADLTWVRAVPQNLSFGPVVERKVGYLEALDFDSGKTAVIPDSARDVPGGSLTEGVFSILDWLKREGMDAALEQYDSFLALA